MDLDLKRLIRYVQQQLEDSELEREASGQRRLFKVDELTIELTFAIAAEKAAKGGFSIKIIELGASDTVSENEAQKLTLKLSALPDGSLSAVADERDARIQKAIGLYPSLRSPQENERGNKQG